MGLVDHQVLPERLAQQLDVLQQHFEGGQNHFEFVDVASLCRSLANAVKIKFIFEDQITRSLSSVPDDSVERRQRINVVQPMIDRGQRANNYRRKVLISVFGSRSRSRLVRT